jgi:hypothetical protein
MQITIFTSRRDLEQYVNDRTDSDTTYAERQAIVATIAADNHPRYGDDWTEYLTTLPEVLEDLA